MWCLGADAASYYVDQTAGSDANVGTSTGAPWKNCPGMATWTGTAQLHAGDTVYFDRGDTWDLPANAFGPGLEIKAGVHYIGNSWGVGVRARLRANGKLGAGNVRFWEDHATIATEIESFEIDGNGYRANGVDINHSFWRTGLTHAVKRIKNCIVHGQTGNGAEGDYKYGVIVSDNSADASGWVANVEIIDTIVYNVPRVGITIYPGDNGMVSNIVVRGCETYSTCMDPSYTRCHGIALKGNAKNCVIEYSYSHDVNAAALFISGPENGNGTGPTGLTVRFNILQSTAEDGVIRCYKGGNKTVDVYGNIVLQNELTGGLSFSGNYGTLAARIYNNTFYNSFVDIGNPTSTGTIEFRNNIIYELDDVPLTDSGPDITAHSNNFFYRSGGGTLVSSGGLSYHSTTLANYEVNGASANPSFKNAGSLPTGFTGTFGVDLTPNSDGLSLLPGSPAIDTGISLPAVFGGSINSVTRPAGAGWEIGAYEYRITGLRPLPPTNLRIVE